MTDENNTEPTEGIFEDGITGDGRNSPADFNGLLIFAISRVNQLGAKLGEQGMWASYSSAIEEVSILLTAHKDKTYEEGYTKIIKPIQDEFEEKRKVRQTDYNIRYRLSRDYSMRIARSKFRLLMDLCSRKNLFPGKRLSMKASG